MPLISRAANAYDAPDGTLSGLIPVEYSTEIIQQATENSLALQYFRQVRMPTAVQHMPVLDALPVAKWVSGEPNDTDGTGGEKSVTAQSWKGLVLTAEEIAAIVPVPEAVLEDIAIDVWSEITPRLGEAIGYAIDAATLVGQDKPTSWPTAIVPAAIAAGNEVENTLGTAADAADYDSVISQVEQDGFFPTRVFASMDQRSVFRTIGAPNYLTDIRDDGRVDSIYGVDVTYDRLGGLNASASYNVKALAGDPRMAIIGTRVDMQYKLLDQATIDISAAQNGSAMVSLAQQDMVALRVRARFGFAVANPPTKLNANASTRYPFAVLHEALV